MLFRCTPPHAPADHGHGTVVARAGRRSRTVDIHCHIYVPDADRLVDQYHAARGSAPPTGDTLLERSVRGMGPVVPKLTEPSVRIAEMDRLGIDIQAVSPSPAHFDYFLPPDLGRDTCRLVNDKLAELVALHPDRLVGMGTVPLQDCRMAVAEVERMHRQLGFNGVEISTNVMGKDLTKAGLEAFFAKVEELGMLVFIHPRGTAYRERMGEHHFANVIGHPLEHSLAIGYLIFDGYLERYPGIKICVAHGGGYVPTYAGRWEHSFHAREDCRLHISKPPSEYMKKLYFDTVVFAEDQLRHMIEKWGADHVLLGSDYPFDMAEEDPVGFVESVRGLSEADRALVLGGNAARLLGLPAKVR